MKNYSTAARPSLNISQPQRGLHDLVSGSEWSPVWEALARQKLDEAPARPTWIPGTSRSPSMASGYTQVTGRPQAVLLHAGLGCCRDR